MLSYGEFLRLKRKALGLSQQDIAEMIGNDRGEISKYETDKILPSLPMLLRIRRVLGLSYEEMLKPLEQDVSYKEWRKEQLKVSLEKFSKDNGLSEDDKILCQKYLEE